MSEEKTIKLIKWAVAALVLLLIFAILKPYEIVDSGNKGLVFRMGELQNEVMEPGLNWKTPLVESVEEITIRPIQVDYEIKVDSNGAITKDNQTVGASVNIFYKYKDNELVRMWNEIGKDTMEGIVVKTVQTGLKEVIGTYDIFTIAEIREKIQGEVQSKVAEDLKDYPVEIDQLLISNYDWAEAFDLQIAETMKMAQQVKQAEQNKLKVEQEQGEKLKIAEADKASRITLAEGKKEEARLLAKAKELEGEGIRKFNESLERNWSIELQKMEIDKFNRVTDKWNGVYVPNNMYGPIPVDTQGGVQGK